MEKRRYKIKPPEVWTQVRKDYLSGLDAKTVAARHDVTEASIRARATKEGWSRHPRSEAATPAPQPLSPDDVADLSPDDPNDPAALARAAAQASGRALHAQDFAQASGRALHAQDFAQARALAALAETYRKLADRDGPGRAARLTVKNAPLQLVFDILTNEAEAERRFAMNTSDKSDWELRGQYWQAKQKLERANTEWGHAQLARRVQLERRIAALEDQLCAAGLDPVIEREQDRRISKGLDLYVGRPRGIISMEEWDRTLDEL